MARIGIKARLGLVALAPALAVAVGAGSIASDKAEFRRDVDELRSAARLLDDEARLRVALSGESAYAQALVRIRSFGATPALAKLLIGRNPAEEYAAHRDEVDERLGGLPPDVAAAVRARVRDGRAELEKGGTDYAAVSEPYRLAGNALSAGYGQQQERVRDLASRLGGTGRITEAVDASRRAGTFLEEGIAQGDLMADLVYTAEEARTPKLLALAASHGRFVSVSNALHEYEGTRGPLERLQADPDVAQSLDRVTRIAVQGDIRSIPDGLDRLKLAATFKGNLMFFDLASLIVDGATDSLLAAADQAAESASRDLRTALIVLTSVLLGTVCIAAGNAVSLARSLRRLADDVRAVQEGDLDHTVAQGSGTREVAVLEHALGDLVINLRTVDRQARALADGALDAPVLDEVVPGTLGRSLRASVERLSDVMAEERALRERLAHAASHDSLTGLVNRSGVLEHIDRELASASRSGRATALVFIDLDDFKRVNDLHGHAAGDEVLREVAGRLHAGARAGDVMARLGGDEFLAVLPGVDGPEEAVAMATRLLDAARQPIVVDGERFVMAASIGVAIAHDGGIDGVELLEQADIAVFRAKTRGRGRVELFDAELQRQLEERSELERALADGLARGELVVHYQPIVDHADLSPVGVEALVRWQRPGHGLVPPGVFIPVAEASDLIVDVGRHVLRAATAELSRGPLADDNLEVAVNVSARHVASGSLLADVREALVDSGLEPSRLMVEITETVLVTDLPFLAEQLDQLRRLGVRVAIDDFGTGFTSLAHLRQLPADVIKIDRSFVADMADDDGSLVRLVIDLGHQMDLQVVAEGVETDVQLAKLRHLGCDRIQGYLLARPMPAGELPGWFATHRRAIRVATGGAAVA